jgi:hypothetical protein
MPWRRTDAVKERTKFVLEWERLFEKHCGMVNLSETPAATFGSWRTAPGDRSRIRTR